jgi:hypothetical protein
MCAARRAVSRCARACPHAGDLAHKVDPLHQPCWAPHGADKLLAALPRRTPVFASQEGLCVFLVAQRFYRRRRSERSCGHQRLGPFRTPIAARKPIGQQARVSSGCNAGAGGPHADTPRGAATAHARHGEAGVDGHDHVGALNTLLDKNGRSSGAVVGDTPRAVGGRADYIGARMPKRCNAAERAARRRSVFDVQEPRLPPALSPPRGNVIAFDPCAKRRWPPACWLVDPARP